MRKSVAMKMTTVIRTSLAVSALAMVAVSCNNDKTTPGYTYMDDMYVSPSLETYQSTDMFENGMEAQTPVEGTIPRGYHPYLVPNTNEGYMMTQTNPADYMPADFSSMDPKEGEKLYNIFCSHCHGVKGDGQGPLSESGKFPGVPGYASSRLPDITPASAYHVIMYGKNNMGSHASQLTYEERWKIIRYVWKLRADQSGTEDMSAEAPAADGAAEATETEEMEEQA